MDHSHVVGEAGFYARGSSGSTTRVPRLLVWSLFLVAASVCAARAEIGVVVYGSKGTDLRRTSSGHIALVVTDLCASGVTQVRRCVADEAQGVVITKYPDLATDYGNTIFVAPLAQHFLAVAAYEKAPVLGSSGILFDLQVDYWRDHLQGVFPALSKARYEELTRERSRFRLGRTIREVVTLEFLAKVLAGHPDRTSVEGLTITNPQTGALIPNGRWREVIGTQYVRSAVVLTIPTATDRELRLNGLIDQLQHDPFNVLTNNCSDFTKKSLARVLGDEGFHTRPRWADPADAWITTPILVTSGFVQYAKKNAQPLHVQWMPMAAGTRRPSFSVKPVSEGALVPDPSQGKLAFGLKVYVNSLNPELGLTALAVSRLSRFTNLRTLIYRGSRDGAAGALAADGAAKVEAQTADTRAARMFGTPACWSKKQDEFAKLATAARNADELTESERRLMLVRDRPFLLPQFYEMAGAREGGERSVMEGVDACVSYGCGVSPIRTFLPSPLAVDTPPPGRGALRTALRTGDQKEAAVGLRLMMTVINYDLTTQPDSRRFAAEFDSDWQLMLQSAEASQVRVPETLEVPQSMAVCSQRESERRPGRIDVVTEARRPLSKTGRWMERIIYSSAR